MDEYIITDGSENLSSDSEESKNLNDKERDAKSDNSDENKSFVSSEESASEQRDPE
jgi:hypothetical protein